MCISKNYSLVLLTAAIVVLAGCNEKVDVHTKSMDRTFLVVEAMLTDRADEPQKVTLSRSIDYFEKEVPAPVSGAEVKISDGISDYPFTETPSGSGCYIGPEGFCGTPGTTYKLSVDAEIDSEKNHYEAESTMVERGFDLTDIDYMYGGNEKMNIDSLWLVAMWGKDYPITSYYFLGIDLNGTRFPLALSEVIDDKYFAGQDVVCFPVKTMSQTAMVQKQYGECGKYLERGDVITFTVYSIPKEYFEFFMGFISNSVGSAIPLLQSQPANCPTNIKGGDAVGFFAACSTSSASVTIEDPLRPYYKKALPLP